MKSCLTYLTDARVDTFKDIENVSPEAIENAQVIITTTKIFTYIIQKNFLQLITINLLIIDECHAVMDQPEFLEVCSKFPQFWIRFDFSFHL